MLMFIPLFLPPEPELLVVEEVAELKHAQLSAMWIKALFRTDPWTDANNAMVRSMCLHLVGLSLAQAGYYSALTVFLEEIDDYATHSASRVRKEDILRMEVMVLDYVWVCILVERVRIIC